MTPDPIYTPETCSHPAYQLNWSYAVFWRERPPDFSWLPELTTWNERDQIRILQHEFKSPNLSQFLVSTQPQTPPLHIAQRIKGRLQRLVSGALPAPFQRNYSLRSIGSTRNAKLQCYLASQLAHHPMVDSKVQERFKKYQIYNPQVDLSAPRSTSHARYWHNLHLVLVTDARYREIRNTVLQGLHDMIQAASRAKGHLLARAAILPDHLHLALGALLKESPEEVALSYLNNLAYVCGMKGVFAHGYYVGTFSEYDLGAIPRL